MTSEQISLAAYEEIGAAAMPLYRDKGDLRPFYDFAETIERFMNPRPKLSNEEAEEALKALNRDWV